METSGKPALARGCYVATLTPYDAAGNVDAGAARAHAAWLVERGIAGLSPAGTTGEFLYLTEQEKRTLVEAAIAGASGRAPVMAGVWALTAAETSRLARAAEDAGASAVFLQTPIYYPADDEAIYAWYEAVHRATSLPVFAYSIPRYAANEVRADTFARMVAAGVVAGIKDSSANSGRMAELIEAAGCDGLVFAASDSFASEGRRLGAQGFISAIANVAPDLFARLWAGDETLQPRVDALRLTLKRMGSLPALKYLLRRHGLAFGGTRIPFGELTAEQKIELDAIDP